MIGELPTALEIGGTSYSIRSDFRVALNIIQAMNDPELNEREKCWVCMKCLYTDFESIPDEMYEEAAKKAYWFIGGGDIPMSSTDIKTFDWHQDESLIFSAVNKTAGFEVRTPDRYTHWWTFLGYFAEIGEGMFSQITYIRTKQAKGKKLEKWEKEFVREHRELITLKKQLSAEEEQHAREDEAFINDLIGR